MNLFIPEIGTKIKLEQDWQITLYSEYRNYSLFKPFDLNSKENSIVELPKGLLLKVDRFYIRKGSSQFSSLTFSIPKVKTKAEKLEYPHNITFGGCKFWVKLHECNGLNMSLLESDKETVQSIRELYLEMERECNLDKNTPFKNSTSLLRTFNSFLGSGQNLNNLYTNLSTGIFLQKMIDRMEKTNEKNIDIFRERFRAYLRDHKLKKLLEND
jgi:hypothetical protein